MTTATHPVQIELPGQAHVAPGPHDQTGMYLMHHAFRRDLGNFVAAVRQTPLQDRRSWAALSTRWQRFGAILHHHHTVEDEHMWPALVAHAQADGDRAALATLAAMEAEHEQIDPTLAGCDAGFQAMVDHPCADHRNALDVHITAARDALGVHLAHEETDALPYVQRVMTEAEFAATEKAAGAGYPPRLLPFLVAWVSDGLPASVMQPMLRSAGPVYSLMLTLARPGYARATRRAFAHV